MTPDTRYVFTKCFSSDKEEKNQGGIAESFVPTKGGWFLFYVLKDVFEKSETQNFITSYKASLRDRYYSYEEYDSFPWSENI
jgi:hypothetical protein